MAFTHGIDARFYYHTLDLSDYTESIDPEFSRELDDIKAAGTSWVQRVAGIRLATFALAGVYDGAASANAEMVWSIFNLAAATPRPFIYLPYGDVLSNVAYMGLNNVSGGQYTAGDGALRYPVSCIGSTEIDRGRVLHVMAEEDTTGAEASDNNSGASTAGGVGVIICTALNATETLDVLIEHSTNDSDWTTLITFTQLAAIGSERIEVTTNPVKQYVRASWTLSAGGIATFAVAFARR